MSTFPRSDRTGLPADVRVDDTGRCTTVTTIAIERQEDILIARQGCRDAARQIGLGTVDQTRLATVISELARNALRYGGGGVCRIVTEELPGDHLLRLEIEDHGPGIPDVAAAMEPGFSTGGGYGLGLPAVAKLMDRLEIDSRPGHTLITTQMRRRRP
jgi:serine/threonine-protein kinase RsbT